MPSKRSTSKNLCLFYYVVSGDSLAQCYLFVLQYLSLYSQRLGYLPAKFEKLVSDCILQSVERMGACIKDV